MPKKIVCRCKKGVEWCKSPRCPERIAFFTDVVVNERAKVAAARVEKVQIYMREELGMKGTLLTGVDDLLPGVKITHEVWSEEDYQRLRAMIGPDRNRTTFTGTPQRVKLSDITSVRQSLVKFAPLAHYLNAAGSRHKRYGEGAYSKENHPVLVRNGSDLALIDGTHRFTVASLLEEEYLDDAIIVDLI